jgi:hypothetical protein
LREFFFDGHPLCNYRIKDIPVCKKIIRAFFGGKFKLAVLHRSQGAGLPKLDNQFERIEEEGKEKLV